MGRQEGRLNRERKGHHGPNSYSHDATGRHSRANSSRFYRKSWSPSLALFTAANSPCVHRQCCSLLQPWCPSSLLFTATNLVSIVNVVHCYRPGIHRQCCSLLQPGDHSQCCSQLETVLVATVSVVHCYSPGVHRQCCSLLQAVLVTTVSVVQCYRQSR